MSEIKSNENSQNPHASSIPKIIYPFAGIIGLVLVLYVILHQGVVQQGNVNEELMVLEKTPMVSSFNPSIADNPGQLEYPLSGTAEAGAYRGTILTNIKMSQEYPGVIAGATLKNIGDSDIEISQLRVLGLYNKNSVIIFQGYFVVSGLSSDYKLVEGKYFPPFPLKQGESKEIEFKFATVNGGQKDYHPISGIKPDNLVLKGNGKETGLGMIRAVAKAAIK